jgi:hypothetical protein
MLQKAVARRDHVVIKGNMMPALSMATRRRAGSFRAIQRVRLSKRIGRPLAGKFDNSLDSSCPGRGRQFGDPIDREVG